MDPRSHGTAITWTAETIVDRAGGHVDGDIDDGGALDDDGRVRDEVMVDGHGRVGVHGEGPCAQHDPDLVDLTHGDRAMWWAHTLCRPEGV